MHVHPQLDPATCLPITECVVSLPSPGDRKAVLCYARIVVAGCLLINSIRLIRADDGHCFVAMPSKRLKHADRHRDLACPLTPAMRSTINNAVIAAYRDALALRRAEGVA